MDLKYRKVEDITEIFSGRLMQHARDVAKGIPSPGPFAGLLKQGGAKKSRRKAG